MGGTARQFNKFYIDYKKRFKKPIYTIASLMPKEFTDDLFVNTFIELYPNLWEDLNKQYDYWHKKNIYLIKRGKKSRYNFRKPYNFILDCSYHCRKKLRSEKNRTLLSGEEAACLRTQILGESQNKLKKREMKVNKSLYYVQEIDPKYKKVFIDEYFMTHDLHERLEIMRELSKYKSDDIIEFFYKVNACTRNHSLKIEAQNYIQGLQLPFYLRRKKKGKTNYIDNEIVENNSSPEILRQRLYLDKLEQIKEFDIFFSHNSQDEGRVVELFKNLNSRGFVVYIDWVNDKYDLKREWCNALTAQVIKERIKQSKIFLIYVTQKTLSSKWCPWELGYADALGKGICILLDDNIVSGDVPRFYSIYHQFKYNKDNWLDGENKSLESWLKAAIAEECKNKGESL